MSYQDGNSLHELWSGYIVNPPKDYKPEKQKKLTDMFSNAALRENTFLKYLLLYMIINTSVMIVPIMRVRTVLRIYCQMLVTTTFIFSSTTMVANICLQQNCIYPYLSDPANKCNNSIWYDFNRKRLHVDVWFLSLIHI